MKIKKPITLSQVKKIDHVFLYDLLAQRRSLVNISHKRMPTWEEHVNFVRSRPYAKWYIIFYKTKKIGTIYLSKQNEIGIHLLKKYEKNSIYTQVINEIMLLNPKSRFLANVSPKNRKYIKFFEKLGFKMIQHTYELDKRINF